MFDFIKRNLSLFVMIGVTFAVGLALAGGDLTQFADAARTRAR